MGERIRETRSVCPVCRRNLPAWLTQEPDGTILLEKHEYNKTRPYKHGKKF